MTANTTIGILGTVHHEEFRTELGYSLERMRSAILEFRPDVICGEVRPQDWQKYLEDPGYAGNLGSSEYRQLILPLCQVFGIEFVPVDWFEIEWFADENNRLDHFRNHPPEEAETAERQLESLYKDIFEAAKVSSLPCNSFEVDRLVQAKMTFLEYQNPVLHFFLVGLRNRIMVERIKSAVLQRRGKRILCTVDFEHNAYYFEGLQGDPRWDLAYPLLG
jgi:hypothetical protein